MFALVGLLIAFTVSGALHRFDERRQLVLQEATAVSTAYDRLDLFEGDVARTLQKKLKVYVGARIDLYRMPHDFSLWDGAEVWSRVQLNKIQVLKTDRYGRRPSQFARRPIFTPRVHRLFRHSAAYSTSRGCAPAPPKSTRLTSST